MELYNSKVTRLWGWDRRDHSQKHWNEYYFFHRFVRFRWAKTLLREHVLRELNVLLERLEIDARVLVKGLPSSEDVLKIQEQMRNGEISFSEAVEASSF